LESDCYKRICRHPSYSGFVPAQNRRESLHEAFAEEEIADTPRATSISENSTSETQRHPMRLRRAETPMAAQTPPIW
jgi:hypothetical protein